MNWKILKTEPDYEMALARTINIFDAQPDTKEAAELELLLLLVSDYEAKHFPLPAVDAVEVIKLKMEERGLKPKDLEPIIGSKGHVSQILNRKRALTLAVAKSLRVFLNIPAEVFLPLPTVQGH